MQYNRDMESNKQRLIPFLTFHGNAEEAMNFYESILPGARIESIVRYEKEHRGNIGKVMTGILSYMNQKIMFLDMIAEYECPSFNWATSLYVDCNSTEEFDALFNGLSQGGIVMMKEEPFMHFRKVAWITDKYGVTWQPVLE